jgi:hypothetical protein
VSGPRFQPVTSRIESRSVNHSIQVQSVTYIICTVETASLNNVRINITCVS